MIFLSCMFLGGMGVSFFFFLHEVWPGGRAHYVNYEYIDDLGLDCMSPAPFCQGGVVLLSCI